jgi:hypothetical protein
MSNISAENQNLFRRSEECLRVEGRHFQYLLCSVNKCRNFLSLQMLSAYPGSGEAQSGKSANFIKILPVYTGNSPRMPIRLYASQ